MLPDAYKNFFKTMVNLKIPEIKQAWRGGIVCVACLTANEFWLKNEFPGWVVITAIVCLQANFGATIRRAKQRLVGTVFGCALAFIVTFAFPGNSILNISLMLLSSLFAIYNSVYTVYSYTYTIFFFTFGLMSLYSIIFPDGIQFAVLRIEDVALGAFFGTLGSLLLWPDFARKVFRNNLIAVVNDLDVLFKDVSDWIQEKIKDEEVYEQKVLSATNNQIARSKIVEIVYELGKGNFPLKEYEEFILSQERIHYSLLTVYNTVRVKAFEKRQESLSFVIEQLNAIHVYFKASATRLPLTKKNALEILKQEESLSVLDQLEQSAMKMLYQNHGKTISLEVIKQRSLLERLLQEVKSMNLEINKILEFYKQ